MKDSTSAWEVIQALRALQTIDDEVSGVAEERDRLRGRLDQLKQLLDRGREDLATRQRKIVDAESWYREQTLALKSEQEKLGVMKSKLAGVTKSKEYMAIQRELEMLRQNIGEKEDELERFTEALDSHKSAVKEEDDKLAALEKEANDEDKATQSRLDEFEAKIKETSIRRQEWIDIIPADILRRYERVKSRREGLAIVPAVDGRCSGCYMAVPPQLYNVLLRRDSLEICPSCNRYIFYRDDVPTEEEEEPEEPVKKKATKKKATKKTTKKKAAASTS